MTQSRTHNCNELRLSNAGEKVTLVGWYENLRKVSKNLGFLILRDFYGTTQIVVETEEMMEKLDGVNKESTISVTGTVRERSNKNTELPTGEIEVVPEGIEILGKCIYNAGRKLDVDIRESLIETLGESVFETTIRNNVALGEAQYNARSIFDYAPSSNGARDYRSLTEEFLKRIRKMNK